MGFTHANRLAKEGDVMRIVVRILAILLILVGIVWILQGINVLPGSFMTGQIQWAYRGGAAAVVGLAILLFARRTGKRG
jgi:type IV secretory pathway VirB6-like protein